MDARDFLALAAALADKETPSAAELRTAVSRAYYALYNTAVGFLRECKVSVADNQQGHRAVPKALRACGDKDLRDVAAVLDALRTARWEADYEMSAAAAEHPRTVRKHVARAKQALRLVEDGAQDAKVFAAVRTTLRAWAAASPDFRVD